VGIRKGDEIRTKRELEVVECVVEGGDVEEPIVVARCCEGKIEVGSFTVLASYS
jgi:hypothetical protein